MAGVNSETSILAEFAIRQVNIATASYDRSRTRAPGRLGRLFRTPEQSIAETVTVPHIGSIAEHFARHALNELSIQGRDLDPDPIVQDAWFLALGSFDTWPGLCTKWKQWHS